MGAFLMSTHPDMGAIMTDEATTEATTEATVTETAAPDYKAKYESLIVDSRKWEGRAKENYEAKVELDKVRDAQKTEAQKIADKMAATDQRAIVAELKALRYEVGNEQKVPPHLVRYLTGANKEELEASAAQLAVDFKPAAGDGTEDEKKPGGRPKEKLTSGNTGGDDKQSDDPGQRARDYYATAEKTK